MNEEKWYVLKVVSGQEKKIKSQLEAEFVRQKIESLMPQMLIPSETVYELKKGKRQTKERNFFPGYVLVCADLSDGRVIGVIKNVPGALGFLGTQGWGAVKQPVPLRQAEINKILGRVDEASERVLSPEVPFVVGEMIKVIDGPFSGFSGTIQEIFEERKKLNITVKIFERNTPIELGYAQVEKIS